MKDPRITVVASAGLLAQLLNADTALKKSRMPVARKQASELHALIVQLSTARSKADAPLLVPSPSPPES